MMLEFPDNSEVRLRTDRFAFDDHVNGLFSLQLHVVGTEPISGQIGSLVGKKATFRLDGAGGLEAIRGIVCEAFSSGHREGHHRYTIQIVPPHWLLSRRVNHRIFQNRSVPQIVADVCRDYSIVDAPTLRLEESYAEREYVTQYGEDDLAFLLRILAEEGIASYFDHAADSGWFLTDRTSDLTPEREEAFPYLGHEGSGQVGVTHLSHAAQFEAGRTHYRDYDFTNPGLSVEGRSQHADDDAFSHEADIESYEYHVGAATDPQQAERRAAHARQASQARARRFEMTGNFAVAAGTRIRISGYHEEIPATLLVTSCSFSGLGDAHTGGGPASPPGERHDVEGVYRAIDARMPLRPPRRSLPRMVGTHTAMVVGAEPGEEIDVDAHGRILVRFPWDRRGLEHNTSRRVRVSQGWAGPDYGLVCLPRVGDEVVVTFLACDVDQPLVIGRVFNGHNPGPLSLPQERTQSIWRTRSSPGGGGYNELMFEDRAGGELVRIHAQRNYERRVRVNSTTRIGNDRTMNVGGDTTSRVDGGHSESVGEDMSLEVEKDRNVAVKGAEQYSVGEERNLRVGGRYDVVVEDDATEVVSGEKVTQVKGNVRLVTEGNLGISVDGDSIADYHANHSVVVGDRLMVTVGSVNVSIDADGSVTLEGATTVRVECDDTLSLTSQGAINVESHDCVKVEGSSRVVVRGGQVIVN